MTQLHRELGTSGAWELDDQDWHPPPGLRAYVVPPAAIGAAGRLAAPTLFDAEGRTVWARGWGRWGVLYARWRLHDGRWLQARRKFSQGAQARTGLAVTAAEIASNDRQARWHAPERFPASDLLGPLPEEDPAWAALCSASMRLEDIDALRRRREAQGTLGAVRAGTVAESDARRVGDAAAWHRAAGAVADADELQASAAHLAQLGQERRDRSRAEADQGKAAGEMLAAELRELVEARLAGMPEASRSAARLALQAADIFDRRTSGPDRAGAAPRKARTGPGGRKPRM